MTLSRENKFFIILSLFLILSLTITFVLIKFEWYFYLVGVALAIATHIIMVIQNRKFYNVAQNEFLKETFHPRISSIIWYLVKGVLVISVTILLLVLSDIYNDSHAIREIFLYVGGYLTIKATFIVSLLINKERGWDI